MSVAELRDSLLLAPLPPDTSRYASMVEIKVAETDLRIEACRASGKGRQHVNTTDSAVPILHLPTGIAVLCQNELSQGQNKAQALQRLRAKLFEVELQKQAHQLPAQRKAEEGMASPNQPIHSYNYQSYRVSVSINISVPRFMAGGRLGEVIAAVKLQQQQEALQGAPALLQLPYDRPRPSQPSHAGGRLAAELPAALEARLRELAGTLDVNLQALLLGSLQVLLARYSGQGDVVVGVPVAGRDLPESLPLLGCFVNPVAVRCCVDPAASLAAAVRGAAGAMLGALAHSLLPFQEVVREAGVARLPGVSPLFQPSDVQLLLAWGAGQQCPQHLAAPLVHEAFAAAAAAAPASPCLLFEGACLTYHDVQQRCSRLAAALMAAGVRPGVSVGVLLQRGAELPVAALAVWAAGGCYVPLDPSYPEQRLAGYLADSGAGLLLSSSSLQGLAHRLAADGSGGVQVLLFDQLASITMQAPDQLPPVPRDAPAYIIFTSGSTGRPKGVQVTHTAFSDYMACAQQRYRVTAADAGVLCSSVNFDAHMVHMMLPLLSGGRLVVVGPDGHLDFEHMAGLLVDNNVSLFDTVPPLLAQYLAAMDAAGLCSSNSSSSRSSSSSSSSTSNSTTSSKSSASSLRFITVGGDQLPLQLAQQVHALLPAVELCNEYGPAEATIGVTSQLCLPGMQCVTIGGPHANVHCYVVDSQLQLVPPGVAGELLLAGPRLAAGYVGLPVKTAAAFIPNPAYSLVQAQLPPSLLPHYSRAYRSGDLVRWLPGGQLQCLGRIDRQVKIAGVRIELGEVEAALAAAPGVDSAVAAAVAAEAVVVDLARLALLPAAKSQQAQQPQADPTAPATAVEQLILGVWQEVLQVSGVGVHDDYWALGGTSLLAGVIMSKLRALTGLSSLPSTLAYTSPTVAGMAAHIQQQQDATPPADADTSSDANSATTSAPTASWLPQRTSTHPLVLLVQTSVLLLTALLHVAAKAAPTYLVIVIISWLGLQTAYALTGPVLVGRLPLGEHPLWGGVYLRWWTGRHLLSTATSVLHSCQGSPLHSAALRLMGAKDGAAVGLEATLQPATLEAGGRLVIRPVQLGAGCSLGSRSYVQGGCCVPDECSYPPLTVLTPATISKQQGQPARDAPHQQHSRLLPALKVVIAVAVMLLEGYAYVPLLAVIYALRGSLSRIAPVVLSTSASAVGLSWTGLVFWVALLPMGLFMLPETYFVAVVAGRLMDSPLMSMTGLGWDGSWAAAAHYNALGASVGRRTMVPLPTVHEPDLLVVGDDVEMGSHLSAEFGLTLHACSSVTNSCVGDFSYLPAGTSVPGFEIHIGAPSMFLRHNREGKAMLLPDNTPLEMLLVHSPGLSSLDTHSNGNGAVVHISSSKDCSMEPTLEAPAACMPPHLLRGYYSNQLALLLGFLVVPSLTLLPEAPDDGVQRQPAAAGGGAPGGALLGELLIPLFMAGQKWLFMGRMKPGSHRFFSAEHTRWLVCSGVQMTLGNSLGWEGTAFQAWLWRLSGACVGKGCCLFGEERLEMDLLHLGDNVVVGEEAILQGHTIENHRLQYSATHIASCAVLGARSSLLPGSSVQAGGRVGPCSLVMKGEVVTAGAAWQGLPAAPLSH
ncbi:hypothetical protein COO60DRAFT_1679963 [Scenedesmus sp. NREL 46B-D3]|nr:hypothetical protein COO60DRAFT_1679963 [Scenedesmus sp. NREL 46B-D3]